MKFSKKKDKKYKQLKIHEKMSNKIKKRSVGAQTQKKWRPGGPPLEGRGRRVEPGGVGAEGSGARGVGPRPRKSQGTKGWGRKGGGPKGRAPQRGGSKGGGPKAGGPKFALFFPSPAPIFALFLSLSLSGGLLVEIWWCLKRRDP